MKNHKGAIATLLTLALVVLGTLIVFGLSFLTNNNKIASNPRAAEDSCNRDVYPDDSCWIVKCWNGKPDKHRWSPSLCQYDIPSSSCSGGSTYSGGGLMVIGEAAADAYLLPQPTFTCTGSGGSGSGNEEQGGGGGTGSPDQATAKCPKTDYNCNIIDVNLYKDHVLSIDKDGLYYDGNSCKGTGMKKGKIKTDVCDKNKITTDECFDWNCQDIKPEWNSIKLLAMGDGTNRTYYTDLNRVCNSKSYTIDTIKSICDPAATPTETLTPTETPTPTPYKIIVDQNAQLFWSTGTNAYSCNKIDKFLDGSVGQNNFIKKCYEGRITIPEASNTCNLAVVKSKSGAGTIRSYLYCCKERGCL